LLEDYSKSQPSTNAISSFPKFTIVKDMFFVSFNDGSYEFRKLQVIQIQLPQSDADLLRNISE